MVFLTFVAMIYYFDVFYCLFYNFITQLINPFYVDTFNIVELVLISYLRFLYLHAEVKWNHHLIFIFSFLSPSLAVTILPCSFSPTKLLLHLLSFSSLKIFLLGILIQAENFS